MHEIRYLNVDCILRSEKNLSDLLMILKNDIFLLWNDCSETGSFVGFETNLVGTSGPEEDIKEFIRLFESADIQEILGKCGVKVFDIGFESGDSDDPFDFIIDHDVVSKISSLGFSIKIRIYPVARLSSD